MSVDPRITRVFIQENGNGKLEPEHRDLVDEFSARGYQVDLFTEKVLTRRRLPLDRSTLVVAYIPTFISALRQLEIPIPLPDDYPVCLRDFLMRHVWESTLGAVRDRVYGETFSPFFMKPRERLKRFTGLVIEFYNDLSQLNSISRQTPVLCSDVVQWESEYRLFVINGELGGIRHYSGDAAIPLDEEKARAAIATLENSGTANAAYGIDFGVLDTGETALVELNDGFSLGSYGLDRSVYADLVLTRWIELVSS